MRLKPGKGVNFPSTELDLPPLTSKDFRDLDFVAEHADLVGFSFVQRVDDIELLQDHLVARAPKREPHGLVSRSRRRSRCATCRASSCSRRRTIRPR